MENKKITNHQLYTITATMSLGGSILVIAATIAGISKQDSWISALITPVFGIFVVIMYYYLGKKHEGLSLIGILNAIYGKVIGFFISVLYIFYFILLSAHIPWYVSSFYIRIMEETPPYVISIIFVACVVVAVLYGLETIARATEFFISIVTVLFIISIILVLNNVKIQYVTPVLENGFVPVLKGSYLLSCFITFSIINVLTIFPRHTDDLKKAKRAMIKGFLWSAGISFVAVSSTILVLGSSIASISNFPTLELAAAINVQSIITRVEYMVSFIWIISEFFICVFFFFSGVTSLSELLGLKRHKHIVLPLGLISVLFSGIIFPNTIYQGNWVNLVYIPFASTIGLFIPLITLAIYGIKKLFFNLKMRRG